ncbi:hypothetical protein [Sphingobium sp. CFD-2]|uniref:hypothetical protein n=1 Tax=Sphingobium sp. CFD-2 TaxID=2878542 RepID=UPI00214C9FE8|nr:hypothetical protein [Sphingobium sp. CFD-2]
MSNNMSALGDNEKYEALSIEWVDAMRRHVTEKAIGKPLDFEVVFSIEYTDPPQHLLRGKGDASVGYTIRVKNGVLEVLDGAHPEEADVGTCAAYDPFALSYRLPLDQYMRFLQDERPKLEAEGKVKRYGNPELIKPLVPVIEMLGFYSKYTA